MEKSGEQCAVVFALTVTEPASECATVCVCVGGGGGLLYPTPLPLAGSVTIYAKTTVHCSPGSSMVPPHKRRVEALRQKYAIANKLAHKSRRFSWNLLKNSHQHNTA
jgi:hypothetical protein